MDERAVVGRPGFQETNRHFRVFAQPPGKRTARRAGAYNNVIEGFHRPSDGTEGSENEVGCGEVSVFDAEKADRAGAIDNIKVAGAVVAGMVVDQVGEIHDVS